MKPSTEQLAALSADTRTGPVVMLNLVKFRDTPEARAEYQEYSKGFVPLLKRCGGTILWAGDVTGIAIGEAGRDAVLVRYPRRQDFVDTMNSPEYAAINDHREAGLAKHVILPIRETYSKLTS